MEINLEHIIQERKNIAVSFRIPLRHIPLIKTDMDDHKRQIEKVYNGMLREACVIDDCCRRFKMMFGWN